MATTVSTTSLTSAETQFLNESQAHARCTSIDDQITRTQDRLTRLQTEKTAAVAAYQATLSNILASKNPAVSIPSGGTASRQTVNGVDSIVVTTP